MRQGGFTSLSCLCWNLDAVPHIISSGCRTFWLRLGNQYFFFCCENTQQSPICFSIGRGVYEVAVGVNSSKGKQEVGVSTVTVQTCVGLVSVMPPDQQLLMTCHLRAGWGALPLRFTAHVVVTTGTTLLQTDSMSQPTLLASLYLHINWVIANPASLPLLS